jgi:acetoin utilization deacetylase AcuC-like enzyme
MTTLFFTHPSGIEHDPGRGHPERPDRLKAVLRALEEPEFKGLDRRSPPRAEREQIARAHDPRYVDALLAAVPKDGRVGIDADTVMCPESGEAALRAAGAVIAAVDAVMAGEAKTAFCAVRPPGHHAESVRGMGFCLFNNVAIGARHARAAHGVGRVAIVDFDVHHGNGTQHMFEDEPEVLFASSHQYPFYPGTGAAEERGVGNVFNAPLAAGSGSLEFRRAMERVILPALSDFRPDLILVSAGFDAHARDPLAQLDLGDSDYTWITDRLREAADASAAGRIVSTLEGGYDLQALAAGVTLHVRGLMA